MTKNPHARALGKRGGKARAAKLSRAQLSEAATHAANSRWISNRRPLMAALLDARSGRIGSKRVEQQPSLKIEEGKYYGYREGDELLSLDELAARLKISTTTAYGLTRRRAKVRSANPLPCFKVGKELRFNWTAVVQWLDALEKGGNL